MKFKFIGEEKMKLPLLGILVPGDEIETEVEKKLKILLGNDRLFEPVSSTPKPKKQTKKEDKKEDKILVEDE